MENFFQGEGGWSMRRFLAFLFALTSIVSGAFCVWSKQSWQITAVAFGVPALACLILMFFTTWTDLSKVISIKKGSENEK